jgi:arsenate reductase (glutaredoxin)
MRMPITHKDTITIYHNPRCGKSRDTLAIIKERGIEPTVIEYLKTPPTKDELGSILKKLGLKPEQLVRKGEEIYKAKFAGKSLSEEQWLEALATNPILIERPIVIRRNHAVIGRPPEKVRELF